MAEVANTDSSVINIIHFNDVYNINPITTKDGDGNIICIEGGASRFKSFVNKLSPLKPIILFSGDFLSPSDMSTVTKGEHMIPIMNDIGITCAMLGNHDLDYGNTHCIDMISKLKYPTLNTNILTPTNGIAVGNLNEDLKLDLEPLGKCMKSYIYKYNDNINIGIIGISENWSCTLPIKPENGLVYLDFIGECQKYVDEMRKENKIDLMIVLSHSRLLNDKLLTSKVNGIDILCGGHDHMYYVGIDENTKTMIVKSGTDFKNVSWIQLQAKNDTNEIDQDEQTKKIISELNKCLNEEKGPFIGRRYKFMNRYYNIDINMESDEKTEKLVHDLSDSFQQQMCQTIGYLAAPIDSRFCIVRSKESTSGNFISDVIRRAYHCDGVIICGGALRADRIMPSGPFTYKDILDIVPFQDAIVVIKLKGSSIIKALEHSVSGIPKAEGRFPQIAGIRFLYDPKEDIGKRIKKVWISKYKDEGIHDFAKSYSNILKQQELKQNNYADLGDVDDDNNNHFDNEHQLDFIKEDEIYTIATREYLANGGDGFEVYKNETIETVIDGEAGIPISIILRNFFWAIDTVNRLLKINQNKDKQKEHETKIKSITSRFSIQPKYNGTSLLKFEKSINMDIDENVDGTDEKKENDGVYVDALTITSCLEYRIMTIDDEIDMQSEQFKPMTNSFRRLPSFVNMKHLPRQQSLMVILDDIEEALPK